MPIEDRKSQVFPTLTGIAWVQTTPGWYLCWYVEGPLISEIEQNRPSDRQFDSVSGHHHLSSLLLSNTYSR